MNQESRRKQTFLSLTMKERLEAARALLNDDVMYLLSLLRLSPDSAVLYCALYARMDRHDEVRPVKWPGFEAELVELESRGLVQFKDGYLLLRTRSFVPVAQA